MYDLLRRGALRALKVPPQPHAPIGDPASLRVFNAGRNYFRLRMTGWAVAQIFALAGFIFWTAFLLTIEDKARSQKEAQAQPPKAAPVAAPLSETNLPAPAVVGRAKKRHNKWLDGAAVQRIQKAASADPELPGGPNGRKKGKTIHGWAGFKQACVELALLLPSGAFAVIWAIKILSFAVYLAQIPLTYAVRRLDFEMRWYMVTDRSLRLRQGVWRISEATMSFANIQEVSVSQGPLQRLLGLADVKVKSAGGGSGGHYEHGGADMHTGLFHCVTNAPEIRDLILERLRRFREAGLGDPDEHPHPAPAQLGTEASADALKAARELAVEARELRLALS